MSKQNIIVGNAVDDGTGDYLRRGGDKINNNFNEMYDELGDGVTPHAAGAWRRSNNVSTPLEPEFGQAWTLDTSGGKITVNLPDGGSADYGKVIKLRDVNGQWGTNPVELVPALGTTIKGSTEIHPLWRDYLDAELVFTSSKNWEYAENKLVSGITSSDLSTVARYEIIATGGQRDFEDMFPAEYNIYATEVYRRGNLLYQGGDIDENSDYGSIVDAIPVASDVDLAVATFANGYWSGYSGSDGSVVGTLEGNEITMLRASNASDPLDTNLHAVQIKFLNSVKVLNSTVLRMTIGAFENVYMYWDNSLEGYQIHDEDLALAISGADGTTIVVGLVVHDITALDGRTIRLAEPCDEGDTVTVVSYLDGLSTYRTSYERQQIRVYDERFAPSKISTIAGQRWVGDLSEKAFFSLDDFGMLGSATFNPFSVEVLINGHMLTKAGDADLPGFTCEGGTFPDALDEGECVSNGGAWVNSGGDFSPVQDAQGRWREIIINEELTHEDIICVRWFDNEIGSTIDWEGDDSISERGDNRWLISESTFDRKGKIQYSDIDNPSSTNWTGDGEIETDSRQDDTSSLLLSIYPIGSIYMNANNPNNPADYMGFGKWVRFGSGRVPVAWQAEDGEQDTYFGLNNNDLDEAGNPNYSAGGTGGAVVETLTSSQIPTLVSGAESPNPNDPLVPIRDWGEKALIEDANGTIQIGGCQFDPDDSGPGFDTYREDFVEVNSIKPTPDTINNAQPYITVHMWLRTQ